MGTHRLAITNLDPVGNQPLEYAGHTLICNGQVYNCQQLAQQHTRVSGLRTDVDIILKALDRFETLADLCRALDGDFAFVLLDRDGGVRIARDPVGVRPLFYGLDERDRVTCAGSEAKALQRIPGVQTIKVFPPGHVFDERTGAFHSYTDVYGCSEAAAQPPCSEPVAQPPCSEPVAQPPCSEPVAQPPCSEPVAQSYAEAVARVRSLVRGAVEKRVGNSDRPVGFLCSGGIDSSIVLALACELLEDRSKVHVFSMEYGEGSSEDAFYASLLAREFGVSHTRVRFSFDDVRSCIYKVARQIESYDPNTIRASVPMYLLAKYIREHTDCTVILSGEGADELFMGYNLFLRSTDGQLANAESRRLIRNIHMFDGLRADRCFNAHGLEVRMPFLDRDLVREVLSMDASHKMPCNRIEKALLRDAFRHLPELGRTRILDRGKERFSDGCGYSYVPALLSHWTPTHVPHAGALETKEAYEAWVYQQWFDKTYPGLRHLVVRRELPAWCGKSQGTVQGILGMSDELKHRRGRAPDTLHLRYVGNGNRLVI
ncbi:hypothetical protein HYH03_015065 [Edaphochlamys debaryana]|uniref:Asparagine synthetase [glutamine-hydrolyzing] n=1 Tax=Edaphochlamys debaryana TaxID=47281 RepID=A0A835XMM6_9CHLO|nr:hypothetical protein HYH03_015065 [Edaphochlamys debaryana]|eukprot:KAG2486240.1 hypothetical protein HYH03_015065 [Edaphochlamys debaryana]